jgi:chromosome segregation ATPase
MGTDLRVRTRELEEANKAIETERSNYERELDRLRNLNAEQTSALSENLSEIDGLKARIESMQQLNQTEISRLHAQLGDERRQLADVKLQSENGKRLLKEQFDRKLSDSESCRRQSDDELSSRIRYLEQALESSSGDHLAAVQDLRRELEERDGKVSGLEQQLAEASDVVARLQGEIGDIENSCGMQLGELPNLVRSARAELEELRLSNEQLRNEWEKVVEERDVLRANLRREHSRIEELRAEMIKRRNEAPQAPAHSLELTYLHEALVNFFAANKQAQEQLVPVILKVVGCDASEIDMCLSQWKHGQKSVFSFF